jgi:hypothetical protein
MFPRFCVLIKVLGQAFNLQGPCTGVAYVFALRRVKLGARAGVQPLRSLHWRRVRVRLRHWGTTAPAAYYRLLLRSRFRSRRSVGWPGINRTASFVIAHCLGAGLAIVPLGWLGIDHAAQFVVAHCLGAGLAVVPLVLLTAWEQVLQSVRWWSTGGRPHQLLRGDRIQNVRGCAKVADAW